MPRSKNGATIEEVTQVTQATEDPTTETVDETQAQGADSAEPAKDRHYIVVTMPGELKDMIVARAEKEELTGAEICRRILAAEFDFTLPDAPPSTRSRRYANEEEKKTAQKARNKAKSTLVRELLAQHKAELDARTKAAEAAALAASGEGTEPQADAPVEGEPVTA